KNISPRKKMIDITEEKRQIAKFLIGGKITGNATATHSIEIQSKSQVLGDIHTGVLSISEGALFEGHCVMAAEQSKVIEMDLPARR
ncbi:MAG: polymer-forming cytoskeletal protein, partial [Nanoarchaeota archaeon]|nr:polymer-forming cytoskeletal protein [Nanoarchaeota archaeon]